MIDQIEALTVVREIRRADDIVITTMGTARDWMAGGIGPLDFVLVPSSMGQATALGLGLAIAQPARRVFVLNGDGSMLMNLGSLVSIATEAPGNLAVVVFDNGVYEITGSQPRPGGGEVDFRGLALASGFRTAHRFATLSDWRTGAGPVLLKDGPVFVTLDVSPTQAGVGPRSPGPAPERARQFRNRLIS